MQKYSSTSHLDNLMFTLLSFKRTFLNFWDTSSTWLQVSFAFPQENLCCIFFEITVSEKFLQRWFWSRAFPVIHFFNVFKDIIDYYFIFGSFRVGSLEVIFSILFISVIRVSASTLLDISMIKSLLLTFLIFLILRIWKLALTLLLILFLSLLQFPLHQWFLTN